MNPFLPKFIKNQEWGEVFPFPWLWLPHVKNLGKFYPEPELVFDMFNYVKPLDVRVVFLFLSPYPDNAANGIATGIKEGEEVRPSFKVLMKALANDYPELDLSAVDTTLKSWVKQGVLMLNASLTTPVSGSDKAREHLPHWKLFIANLLYSLASPIHPCIFILCGRDAQKYKMYFDFYKNPIMEVPHPAATYYVLKENGFKWDKIPDNRDFTNKGIFKNIDQFLLETNQNKIIWNEKI